jgi:hypothetical protein
MGFYIQGPAKGKADFIVKNYSGEIVSKAKAFDSIETHGVIVVVNNGPFAAAAFLHLTKKEEFLAIHSPNDTRPKEYVIMDRSKACELTGYKNP